MRLLSVRLIISLILGITLVSSGFSYYEILGEKRALRSDLEHRAELLGESLVSTVERSSFFQNSALSDKKELPNKELDDLALRFGAREHLLGVAIYDRTGAIIAVTSSLADTLAATPASVTQTLAQGHEENAFVRLGGLRTHVLALPVRQQTDVVGAVAVIHDANYIRTRILLVWRQTFLRVLAQVFLIVVITLLIVRWSIAGPIARAALWMRALRTGKISFLKEVPDLDMFRPLAREVATMAESLNRARNAAENEARACATRGNPCGHPTVFPCSSAPVWITLASLSSRIVNRICTRGTERRLTWSFHRAAWLPPSNLCSTHAMALGSHTAAAPPMRRPSTPLTVCAFRQRILATP